MKNKELKQLILEALKKDDRLWDEKTVEPNQILLLDLVEKVDETIIGLLLQEKTLREKFFVCLSATHGQIKGKDAYVFKINDFRFFMEENEIDNSYTTYKNRIGLTDGKKFLKDSNDVVLDFPYKDCVLEGGQSTEEGTDTYFEYSEKTKQYEEKKGKRKEIFFNSVLAHDEIDRLFDHKALVNWKRYTKDGEIPLLRGGVAEGNDGVEKGGMEKDGVETGGIEKGEVEKWQAGSLFSFWQLPKNKDLTQRAKALRKQRISSKVLFWQTFKDRKKLGWDIDRQVIIGNYIVDFFIAELGLVVEIDGSSHDNKQEYDAEREAYLKGLNLEVFHFSDTDVKKNIAGVAEIFTKAIVDRVNILSTPSLSTPSNPADLPPLKRGTSTPNASHSPLKRGIDGTIKENLIIKGNNLLALHSLKKQFAGKVKLIYIDPPYNPPSSNNTFTYNNNFNHSTWLTFMKNRLEVGKKLLSEDGTFIVAIDENEVHYLGVMIEELFPEYENHCVTIVHNPRGIIGSNFSYTHEYAYFIFPKGRKIIGNRKIEEENIDWRGLRDNGGESLRKDAKNCFYPIIIDKCTNQVIDFGGVCKDDFHPSINIYKGDSVEIYPVDKNGIERKWRYAKQSVGEVKDLLRVKKGDKGIYDIQIGKDFGTYRTVWVDKRYDANEYGTKIVNSLVKDNTFSFPKSLWNIYDCIYAVVGNDKNAIILDYHAGSGTTAHAVLKLNKEDGGNRKFIMVEQMDYINTVTCSRVQKVMEKENIDDSFIYFELAKWNEIAKEKILACKSLEKLETFFDTMYEKYFLNYNLKIKEFKEKVLKKENFRKLSLEEQKKMFLTMLDLNQMYVNKTEMADKKFDISEENQMLTKEFYKEE